MFDNCKTKFRGFCKNYKKEIVFCSSLFFVTSLLICLIYMDTAANNYKNKCAYKYANDINSMLKKEEYPNIFIIGRKVKLIRSTYCENKNDLQKIKQDWNDLEPVIKFAGEGLNLCRDSGVLSESKHISVDIKDIDKWRQDKLKYLGMLKAVTKTNMYSDSVAKTILATDKALTNAYIPVQQYYSLQSIQHIIDDNRMNLEKWKHTTEGHSTILKLNDIINQTRNIDSNLKSTVLGEKLKGFNSIS